MCPSRMIGSLKTHISSDDAPVPTATNMPKDKRRLHEQGPKNAVACGSASSDAYKKWTKNNALELVC